MTSRRAFLSQVAAVPILHGAPEERDTVYRNGPIVTLDSASRTVSAIAVRGGRILAVGSESDVRKAAAPSARIIDLRGRTMLPGFYAAHDHMPQSGLVELFQVDLNSPPMGRIEKI